MLPDRAPLYRQIPRKRRVVSDCDALHYADVGGEFDLSLDIDAAMAACRSAQGLADAIGMLSALAGKNDRTSGFEKAVYVIQVGDDPICKIGVSANPLKRVADLQVAHYRELFLHAVIFCPLRQSVSIEQGVLSIAERQGTRLMGEWINDEPENVLRCALEVARDGGYSTCDGRRWFEDMVSRTKELHRQRKVSADLRRRMSRRIAA